MDRVPYSSELVRDTVGDRPFHINKYPTALGDVVVAFKLSCE